MSNTFDLPTAPAKRHRFGDTREDGLVFVQYHKNCKTGEQWVSAVAFANLKTKAAVRYRDKQALRPKKTVFASYGNSPQFRVRPYCERTSRQKRGLIQKEFDKLPYGPDSPAAMTTTSPMTIIPRHSKYAITPDGVVHRVQPATRGRTAGLSHRVTPVIHPRGHQWCVQITCDAGVRRRIPIKKIMLEVYGVAETNA
jgi:hypothetical protein